MVSVAQLLSARLIREAGEAEDTPHGLHRAAAPVVSAGSFQFFPGARTQLPIPMKAFTQTFRTLSRLHGLRVPLPI